MKIIVLATGKLSLFHSEVLDKIISSKRHVIECCIVDETPPPNRRQRLKRNLKKGRGGYILIMVIKSLFGGKKHMIDTASFFKSYGIKLFRTQKPYSNETFDFIRASGCNVAVYCGGFGYIVKESLINAFPQGILSYHHGDMEKYRGQPAAFWELYHGESEMGATVQRLSPKLDAGEIVITKKITIHASDNHATLLDRLYRSTSSMMLEALDKFDSGSYKPSFCVPGKVFTIPNLRQWMTYKIKMIYRWIHCL